MRPRRPFAVALAGALFALVAGLLAGWASLAEIASEEVRVGPRQVITPPRGPAP